MLPSNPTRDDLNKAWLDWLSANLPEEFTIVFAEAISGKDGPRPRTPYLTIKIISGPRPRGFDELRRKNSFGDFEVGGMRQYTVSLQAFGMGGYDALADLLNKMDDPYASIELKRIIGIVDRGDVLDISALLETGYERRAALDVIFNSAKNVDSGVKPIEHVRIGGTLKQGNQGDHVVDPFTVDKE